MTLKNLKSILKIKIKEVEIIQKKIGMIEFKLLKAKQKKCKHDMKYDGHCRDSHRMVCSKCKYDYWT